MAALSYVNFQLFVVHVQYHSRNQEIIFSIKRPLTQSVDLLLLLLLLLRTIL